MAVETTLETAMVELASAGSLAELLDAACAAADAGETTATALARESVVDGPGYLAAADAFAVVRVGLEQWVAAPPALLPDVLQRGSAETHRLLAGLATALRDRLGADDAETDDVELAVAIADARAAAAGACRALFGPVRHDADVW
jgi:hypothetical protein